MNFKKSYQFGKKQELIVLPIIREYFGDNTIKPTEDKFCRYDYTSEDVNYELKSRTTPYSKYSTTMITQDKLSNSDKPIILLFSFTDGLYMIEHNMALFESFETKPFQRAGGEWKEKIHIYIPIEELKLIKMY